MLFWAPFSLKILLEESSPTRAKQVRVVSFYLISFTYNLCIYLRGKILLLLLFVITIKMTPWSKPFLFVVWNHLRSISRMNCGLGIVCGTVHNRGSLGRSCKLSPPFFLTQPSAPGSHALKLCTYQCKPRGGGGECGQGVGI